MVVELPVLLQGFAKHYGGAEEEKVLEEGGAAQGERVRLPSLPLTIYRGEGEEEAP